MRHNPLFVVAVGEITPHIVGHFGQPPNLPPVFKHEHRICHHAEQGFAMATQSPLVGLRVQSTGAHLSLYDRGVLVHTYMSPRVSPVSSSTINLHSLTHAL